MWSTMYSKRGTELPVVDGYKFRHHKDLANNVQRWMCTKKDCTAYMRIGDAVEGNQMHNHPRDPDGSLTRQKVSNACKRKAIEDIFDRPSKFIRKKVQPEDLELLIDADRT